MEISYSSYKYTLSYLFLYLIGLGLLFLVIAEPFTMSTYFSDNSLLPGLANREFSLATEAEYYLKDLQRLSNKPTNGLPNERISLATQPSVVNYIKTELDSFAIETYEQNFNYQHNNKMQYNGTNLYSIVRGERSTSSEAMVLCVPYKFNSETESTFPAVALGLALTKYFSNKSYWAKDFILLIVDHDQNGLSAWLDSYHDIRRSEDGSIEKKDGIQYESLPSRSGPIQSAIVLELYSKEFAKLNIKIQGMYGQLPNLDLFNLIIELSARESVTPYFQDKSLPFGLSSDLLYQHHLETALSFMKTQATMNSDGLHGQFLSYSIQSLTLDCPKHVTTKENSHILVSSLLNLGRLLEGVFRSLNNLTERFNRSYYFYIILSLRRFTSIGYYMIPFGVMNCPLVIKAFNLYRESLVRNEYLSKRGISILFVAWFLSFISTFNISLAVMATIPLVPVMILLI